MARFRGEDYDNFGDMFGGGPDIQGNFGVDEPNPRESMDSPAIFNEAPEPPPPFDPGGNTEKPREQDRPGDDIPRRPEAPNMPEGGPAPDVKPREPNSTQAPPDVDSYSEPTPPRPRTPTPVASQAPQPFVPLQPMANPASLTMPASMQESDAQLRVPSMAPVMPTSPNPTAVQPRPFVSQPFQVEQDFSTRMFGKAGGLLGGGMGLPGSGDYFEDVDNPNLDELIRTLTGQ